MHDVGLLATIAPQYYEIVQNVLKRLQEPLGDAVTHYFGGGEAAMNLHERLCDLMLMQLSFSMEEPGTFMTDMHYAHI